jgi:hypothetical protein
LPDKAEAAGKAEEWHGRGRGARAGSAPASPGKLSLIEGFGRAHFTPVSIDSGSPSGNAPTGPEVDAKSDGGREESGEEGRVFS